ncbi:MAG: 50S ribosomal protein L30 [Candidatus Zixiibacteriota bacterium]|nr:MAG: 50S ribosomal protein L30 [candidate division Zixibacteria bacterium]HDL04086.1 50S ribosomal protein L30 [candidate division Zixibacteria bacterium]
MAKLKITQVRSAIDRNVRQKRTIEALGLGKLHRTVMLNDTPQIRGMIKAVNHLVEYEKVDE